MYLSIPSAVFRETLTTARTAMGSRYHMPVMGSLHFHVPADGATVEITSTDFDVSLTQIIPLEEPGGPGSVCISLAALSAVKPDRATPVRIDYAPQMKQFAPDAPEAQILYVKAGHSAAASLEIFPTEDFAHWQRPPGPEDFTIFIPGKTLHIIGESIAFQSTEETRPVLQGALLSPDAGGTVCATNGRILARWQTKATPEPVILPTKACQILARLKLPSATAAIPRSPYGDDSFPATLSFRHQAAVLHARLVPGNFPAYRQVIPIADTFTLNSGITFADPAGVASWLQSLPIPKTADLVRICPRAPHYVDLIHAHGHITATAYLENEPPEIAFNPKLLADALAAIPGTLHLTDSESPGVLRHATALAVLMPMRTLKPDKAETGEVAAA